MTESAIGTTAQRLFRQQIAGRLSQTPVEAVRNLGAMQAQDYHGSLWALGLRTGKTEREIIQAIEKREIIRTWPQRGTLHFVPAADAKWLLGLSSARMLQAAKTRRDGLGLDEAALSVCENILTETLAGDRLVARPQVLAALEQAGVSTNAGRGYHILCHFSQRGLTYVGPMQGKQPTFGLLDDLAPAPPALSREAGIAEWTRRYFSSHGPATRDDFKWWASLTAVDAKAGLDANKNVLRSEKQDGKEYWLPHDAVTATETNAAFLLPGFDEYMLGYQDRSAALPPEYAARIVPGGNGVFLPTVVVRGQVVGTWKRSLKKALVQVTITPFEKLTQADQALLEVPAEHYGRFVGLPLKIEIE